MEPAVYDRARDIALNFGQGINRQTSMLRRLGQDILRSFFFPSPILALVLGRIAAFIVGNRLVLLLLPALAGYAGFAALPLYVIPIIGVGSGVWNLLYFGLAPLRAASGGPLAYLSRISIFNSIQAAAFYGVGFGLKWLLGGPQ